MDRSECGLNQSIIVTTRNLSDRPIYKDWCGVTMALVMGEEDKSRPRYSSRRRCGGNATIVDRLARASQMDPGESDPDTLRVGGFVVQGFYRANVWLLAPNGYAGFRFADQQRRLFGLPFTRLNMRRVGRFRGMVSDATG